MNTLYRFQSGSKLISHEIKDILFRQKSNTYSTFYARNSRLLCRRFPEAQNPTCYTKSQIVHCSSFTLHWKTDMLNTNMRSSNILLSRRYNSDKVGTGVATNKEPPTDPILSKEKIIIQEEVPLTKVQMLKKAVAEYGTTVIVFHVSISLISLGVCYMLVSGGVDASQVFVMLGLGESKIASNAGTFVAAYAIHKVMAPLRISITLGATPLIVRYLRNKGILKK